jgi:hypothetical protein
MYKLREERVTFSLAEDGGHVENGYGTPGKH